MKIKICGLTRKEDVDCAVKAGADMIGFIFAPQSAPCFLRTCSGTNRNYRPCSFRVGVFVNEDSETVKRIIDECSLDFVQLHGDESPEYCAEFGPKAIKAFRIRSKDDVKQLKGHPCSLFLLDAFDPDARGGTGKQFDHSFALEAKQYGNIIIAGGLTPDNVADVIRAVHPWGCDVSSGVEEEKGIKDCRLISQFIRSAKEEI